MLLYTLLLIIYFISNIQCSEIFVDTKTGHFIDKSGRVRLFRGINSVVKNSPWYDSNYLKKERAFELSALGFNLVRLGAMWSGIQPKSSENVNTTYLKVLETIVSNLEKADIFVILDVHQDVLWKTDSGAGYDGVPNWLKKKLPKSNHSFPWPFKKFDENRWACGYFTEEINQGFGDVYENKNDVLNDFANLWTIIAYQFQYHTNVLGYELINEPWTGNIFKSTGNLLPGIAGSQHLNSLNNVLSKAIRNVQPDAMIFFEAVTWSYYIPLTLSSIINSIIYNIVESISITKLYNLISLYCGNIETSEIATSEYKLIRDNNIVNIFGPGFDSVPGGDEYLNRSVLSWHYYCPFLGDGNAIYDASTLILCDNVIGPLFFNTVKMRAKELKGSATMLTEFGLCQPNKTGNPYTVNNIECNFILNEADKHFTSWAYWDTASGFVFWDNNNELLNDVATIFSRPYPLITNGLPYRLNFDINTALFYYEFYPGNDNRLATEIFVPPLIYNNYEVILDKHLRYEISPTNKNIIYIYHLYESNDNVCTIHIRQK